MFKLSRFSQEHFFQELCCDSFTKASASQPYSSLGTGSHAPAPWSGDETTINCIHRYTRDVSVSGHVRGPVFDTVKADN